MDPITAALIVGATAALQKTAGQVIEDTYNAFKTLLISRFQSTKAAIELLESDPQDEDSQKVVNKQLQKAKVEEDEEVLQRAQALVEAVKKYAPDTGKQLNIDLNDLKVGGTATIRNIGKTVKGRNWDITKDLNIENVGMGGEDDDPNA